MNRALPVAALALLVSCAGAQKTGPTVHKVRPHKVEIQDQDFTTFTPMAVLPLANDAPLKLVDATYEILVAGNKVASGKVALDTVLEPGERLELVAEPVPYADGDRMAEVLEMEGSLPILMKGEVRSAAGEIYEFSKAGNVRTPRIPSIKVWHIEVSTYPDEDRLSVLFFVRVVNKNPFDIQLDELIYDLAVGGKTLISQGTAGTKEVIGAATGGQIELPVDLTKQNFGDVKKYLRSWSSLGYRIDGELRLGVGRMPVALTGELGDEGDRFEETEEQEAAPEDLEEY